MSLQPPALLREGGGEALRALGSSLGNHFANTTRRGQEIADVVEQSLRSSSPMRALVSQVAAGAEWVASSRGRDNKKEEEGDAVVEAAAVALLDSVRAASRQAAAAGWITTEVAGIGARLNAFLFACLRSTGGDLEEVGELLARGVCEMDEEELGRDKLAYASGSWEAILRAWLRLELLRATHTSANSQEERDGRFQVLCAMVDKEELSGTCQDIQPQRALRSVQDCLDKLAALTSADERASSTFCLPLDLPLHQSLPICLFLPATPGDGQPAAASGAAGTAAGAAAGAAAATAVVSTTMIDVRGAGLEPVNGLYHASSTKLRSFRHAQTPDLQLFYSPLQAAAAATAAAATAGGGAWYIGDTQKRVVYYVAPAPLCCCCCYRVEEEGEEAAVVVAAEQGGMEGGKGAATARCCPPRNRWRPVLPGGCFPGPWVLVAPVQHQEEEQQLEEEQEEQQEYEAASICFLDEGEKSHKHRGASFAVAAVQAPEEEEEEQQQQQQQQPQQQQEAKSKKETRRRRHRPPSLPAFPSAQRKESTVVVVVDMEEEGEEEKGEESNEKYMEAADQEQQQEHYFLSAPPPPSSLLRSSSTPAPQEPSPPLYFSSSLAAAAVASTTAKAATVGGEGEGDDAQKRGEEDNSSSTNSTLLEGRFLRLYQEEWDRLIEDEKRLHLLQRERGRKQYQQEEQQHGREGVAVEDDGGEEDIVFSLKEAVRRAQERQQQQRQQEELEEVVGASAADDEASLPLPVLAAMSTPSPPPSPPTARAGPIFVDWWGEEGEGEGGEPPNQILGSTRVEVLGTERKERKKGGGGGDGGEEEKEEDDCFLVRFTRVEAEEEGWGEEWRGGGGGGKGSTATARLVCHRVRVVRKTRGGLEELHAQLHEVLLRTTTTIAAAAAAALMPTLPDLGCVPMSGRARAESRRQGKEEQREKASLSRIGELFGSSSRQQQQRRLQEALLEEYLRALMEVVEGLSTTAGAAAGAAAAADITRFLRTAFQPEEDEGGVWREDLLIRLRAAPVPDMTSARREELWARQGGKCRGCGQGLLIGLLEKKNFMTCRYLQALFCTEFCADSRSGSSNGNSSKREEGMCVLPGQVLRKWDFRQRRVALPALVFLKSIRRLPVFSLASVWTTSSFPSSSSSSSVVQRQIKYVQNLRRQLQHLSAGLLSVLPSTSSSSSPSIACACPVVRRLLAPVLQSRPHLVLGGEEEEEENENVSLVDLQELQTGVLSDVLSGLLEALHAHVGGRECQYCAGRGPASSYDPFLGCRLKRREKEDVKSK